MKSLFLCVLLGISSSIPVFAQKIASRYGLFGAVSRNYHEADIQSIKSIPLCCTQFNDGSGFGIAGGLHVEFPLVDNWSLGARIGYWGLNGILSETERLPIAINGQIQEGELTHSITASIPVVGIEPIVTYRLSDVVIRGGLQIGSIVVSDMQSKEEITQPTNGGTFLDANGFDSGKRTRNTFSFSNPYNSEMDLALTFNIGYELPLTRRWSFVVRPEIGVRYALKNMFDNISWKTHSITASLSFFATNENRPYFDPSIEVEPVPQKPIANVALKPVLKPSIAVDVTAIETDGSESHNIQVRIEQFTSEKSLPLLPYIFFEDQSSTLPSKYITNTTNCMPIKQVVASGAMVLHQHTLCIIADRMNNNPGSTITLTGTTSNTTAKELMQTLGDARANAVKEHLVSGFGIDPKRITVRSRLLPEIVSNPTTEDGQAENRRVEISSATPELLAIVTASDSVYTVTPSKLRVVTKVNSSAGIRSGVISISTPAARELASMNTTTTSNDLEYALAAKDLLEMDKSSLLLKYTIVDTLLQKADTTVQMPVQVLTIEGKRTAGLKDKRFDEYALVLFDVNSNKLTSAHQPVLRMISSKLANESVVTVIGSTDRTGVDLDNLELARRRAASTAEALSHPKTTTESIGETQPLYNNDVPEGRMYNRTVRVLVETPIR